MRVVSLFSGAGGLDLGLKRAGHEIILQCEQDPGAQQVLRQNFPGTLLLPDVCSIETLPKGCELLVAGFPCIDISRAGLRRGFEGQSSGLVRHVFRLLQDAKERERPVPWVLLENVEALLDRGANGVPHVKSLADTFEVIGYSSWAHRIVCSAGFGLPNRRSRVFFLASMYGDARDVLLAQGMQQCLGSCHGSEEMDGVGGGICYECFHSSVSPNDNHEYSFALDLGNARSAPGVDVVPTFTTNNDRICLLLSTHKMGMLRIEDAERLQGFPEGFTWSCYPIQPPGLNSHKNKNIKDTEVDVWESRRYALLGNAVTVRVAEWLGERLASPYVFKYIPSERDRPVPADYRNPHRPQRRGELEIREDFAEGLLIRSAKRHSCRNNSGKFKIDFGTATVDIIADGEGSDNEMHLLNYTSYKSSYHRATWPRAAWFVSGIGRFGVEDMSECPKKVPFQPIGKFIQQVGKLPGPDVINTYIMRLREQGWNVENIVKKATQCGLNLIKEVSEVVRMSGAPQDPDQIGSLVWCICRVTKAWWPGHMLDPYDLPSKSSIPEEAIRSLSKLEKKAWLPVEYWEEENEQEVERTVEEKKKEEEFLNGQRKVLVMFFGDDSHDWVFAQDTLDFEKHKTSKEREARCLDEAGNLKRPKLFFRALDDAELWLEAKKSNRKNGRMASAVASRAASMAAAENRKPRCGRCESCLNKMNGGNSFSRKCLYVRAQAAAAGGHVGAQVAIHRDRAIGAKLELYWPLDQKWFPGMVTSFDRLRLRHTVLYEDGDREIIPLWSPCQLIRVINQPKDWASAAEEHHRHEEEQQQREAKKVAETTPLTDFEAQRRQMIEKNREMLSMVLREGDAPSVPFGRLKELQIENGPAFNSVRDIHIAVKHVYSSLGNTPPSDGDDDVEVNGALDVNDSAARKDKMKMDVDLYSIMDLGGPCRHTRSVRRELTDFLETDVATTATVATSSPPSPPPSLTEPDPNVQSAKKMKIEELPIVISPTPDQS